MSLVCIKSSLQPILQWLICFGTGVCTDVVCGTKEHSAHLQITLRPKETLSPFVSNDLPMLLQYLERLARVAGI